ncbi:MAG TPA: UvrD-helicase domain-containing protein, partial [Myxococcota bacterium]|nr:UvrD-helicase domain-containing protein [Myxococcota bacterium]
MNVHDAIAKARGDALAARDTERRSLTGLTELREQAGETSADDLPTVLLDMSVRHRLLERGGRFDLPDPASPYLAHLRLREGDVERDYLLGSLTFIESRANVRVVDWRVAPIAQVFYRHREGDAFEHELPERIIEGRVVARRIVVIEKGELRRVVGSDVAIECDANGVWRSLSREALELAGGGAQTSARPGILGVGAGLKDRVGPADITALLDAEQYAAVSAPPEDALLVLGSAGSGKTTVALHRLARICAAQPHKYPLQHTKVVVPEEGLARLSRRLLSPLGAGSAQVQTLDAWAADLTQRIFERELKLHYDAPGLVVSLKRHPETYRAFRERFAKLDGERTTWQRLRRLIAEQFSNRDFLTQIVGSAAGDLSGRCIDAVIQHTMRQLADDPRRELSFITDADRREA